MKKLITLAFFFALVGTLVGLFVDAHAEEIPIVIQRQVPVYDPILDYDFSTKAYPIPPRYNPHGKIDPFMNIEQAEIRKPGTALLKTIPKTPLTKFELSKLRLTSVIVNHHFAYAYFITPDGPIVLRAEVGNYIGKLGSTITSIEPGIVNMSDGNVIAIRR